MDTRLSILEIKKLKVNTIVRIIMNTFTSRYYSGNAIIIENNNREIVLLLKDGRSKFFNHNSNFITRSKINYKYYIEIYWIRKTRYEIINA